MSPSLLLPSWLKLFLAVVEQGSFNKAAEMLLLSQPAVSQKIRQLEGGLGVRLFHRSPEGVRLTPAGQVLLRYAQAVRWLLLAAERQVTAAEPPGELRLALGATPGISTYCLPAWLHRFHQRHPHVLVHLRTAITPRLVEQVARHALPLALIEGELPGETEVAYEVLRETRFVIVTPAREPWLGQQRLPLQALDGQPFVARTQESQTRRWLDRLLRQARVRPRIVAELDSPEAIKEAVAQGMGITLLPVCALSPEETQELHLIEVDGEVPRRYLKAIWAKDVPLHPLALAFLESLQEEFPILQRVVQQTRHSEWQVLYELLTQNTPFSGARE
ncbi:MAG TPA: LysR family transcriptional regulator [Anaerolineae bacterium]|nr:LysR family transcriptional regulator [Anaerolineae bacterium]HIQ09261.1 LysR family transcriptional regulator [Anaerolineaceae bacterium]